MKASLRSVSLIHITSVEFMRKTGQKENLPKREVVSYRITAMMDGIRKHSAVMKLETIFAMANASFKVEGEYPGWAYKQNSSLRDKMSRVYEEMYGKKPVIMAIHAGLECGILSSKIEGLDCISIGPDMYDVHTPDERISIGSIARVWEFIKAVLAEK